MIIPNIWKNKKCSKPPIRNVHIDPFLLDDFKRYYKFLPGASPHEELELRTSVCGGIPQT